MTNEFKYSTLHLSSMKNIHNNLRSIREKAVMSQEKVAELMNVTQSKYARFERGATKIDLEMLETFASVFDLNIVDVLTWPKKYVDYDILPENHPEKVSTDPKVSLLIELDKEKKSQVLKLVFGKNSLEIFNK